MRLSILFAGVALGAGIPVAQAQVTDSLARRPGDLIRLMQDRQAAANRPRITWSGTVLLNAFYNDALTDNDDVPQIAVFPDPLDPTFGDDGGASGTVRQSRLAVAAEVDLINGGRGAALLEADFFGGQAGSATGRSSATLRVRRATATLAWPYFTMHFGQDAPPIADVDPSSVAALGLPGFSGAGNLWTWLPQIRLQFHTAGPATRVGLEIAALAPSAATPQPDGLFTQPDQTESTQRPFLEGRILGSWNRGEMRGKASLGAHVGWFEGLAGQRVQAEAVAASVDVDVTQYVNLRGEGFFGEALGGLGGGIFQNFDPAGDLLRGVGGWVQLSIRPTPLVELGGGYGFDRPDDGDPLRIPARQKNVQFSSHLVWTSAPLLIGGEFRRIQTTYAAGTATNNHINVAFGFVF